MSSPNFCCYLKFSGSAASQPSADSKTCFYHAAFFTEKIYFIYNSLHLHNKHSPAQFPTSSKGAGCLEKGGVEYMHTLYGNDGNKHFQFYKDARVNMQVTQHTSKFCQLLLFESTDGDTFSKTNMT